MLKLVHLVIGLGLSLVLISCNIGQVTDEQIVKKHFRHASVVYDDQGRVTWLGCPKINRGFIDTYIFPPKPCRFRGSLPPEIGQLTELKSLRITGAAVTEIPPEINQLKHLEVLDLSGNNLITLPPEIGQLTELQRLDLRHNQLTVLPPEIGALANLEILDLSENDLTTLPPEISGLGRLTSINLFFNDLISLPKEIGNLTNLKVIGVGNNHNLTFLPIEVWQLREGGTRINTDLTPP